MLMSSLAVLFGLVLLALAADRFVDGAAALARNFGISTLIVGLVIVGFGTSAPELLVSAMASLQGDPGISIGNALGSNISNIALVGGATAVLRPLAVSSGVVRREFRVLGVATLLLWVLFFDGQVSRVDGVILIAALAVALWVLVRLSRGASAVDAVVEDTALEPGETMGTPRALAYAIGGLAGLMIGSRLLVWGASEIAMALGVPNLVIGLTVVAIGTSLPELAAAVVSARKGETDLVIGNIVGSNLFNSLGVIGIPGLLAPCEVPAGVVSRDLPILSALSVLFFWMSARSKKGGILTKPEGLLLLAIFAAYQLMLVLFSR